MRATSLTNSEKAVYCFFNFLVYLGVCVAVSGVAISVIWSCLTHPDRAEGGRLLNHIVIVRYKAAVGDALKVRSNIIATTTRESVSQP